MNWIKCSERMPRHNIPITFIVGGMERGGVYSIDFDEFYDICGDEWISAPLIELWKPIPPEG